jgi:hypothetical protein
VVQAGLLGLSSGPTIEPATVPKDQSNLKPTVY